MDGLLRFAADYDSFEDWPWPLLFRDLDRAFPGSKFILTVRATPQVWFHSLSEHALLTGPSEFSRLVYGYPTPRHHEAEHIAVYERHNAAVREHFRGRPGDLLELCWDRGDGWAQLAPFLGRPVPTTPFPHVNRTEPRPIRWWLRLKHTLSGKRRI